MVSIIEPSRIIDNDDDLCLHSPGIFWCAKVLKITGYNLT
jgi:hypothetical protein